MVYQAAMVLQNCKQMVSYWNDTAALQQQQNIKLFVMTKTL